MEPEASVSEENARVESREASASHSSRVYWWKRTVWAGAKAAVAVTS